MLPFSSLLSAKVGMPSKEDDGSCEVSKCFVNVVESRRPATAMLAVEKLFIPTSERHISQFNINVHCSFRLDSVETCDVCC